MHTNIYVMGINLSKREYRAEYRRENIEQNRRENIEQKKNLGRNKS